MSDRAKYRFLVSWVTILTIAVSVLAWENLTRYVGREERIAAWNARMVKDSLDRLGIQAKIDSVVEVKINQKLNLESVMTWVIPEIPDLSSQVATLMFWIATSTIGALVTALVFIYKERMELVKSFLPLLSEIKVFLQQNLNK